MLVDEVDDQPPTLATFTNLFGAAAAISTEETGAQLDNAAMAKRLLEVINKLCEEHARLQAENERMKVHLDELVRHRRFPCRLLRCRPHRHLLRHHLLHRHLSRHPAAPPSLPPSLSHLPHLPPSPSSLLPALPSSPQFGVQEPKSQTRDSVSKILKVGMRDAKGSMSVRCAHLCAPTLPPHAHLWAYSPLCALTSPPYALTSPPQCSSPHTQCSLSHTMPPTTASTVVPAPHQPTAVGASVISVSTPPPTSTLLAPTHSPLCGLLYCTSTILL